MREASEEGARGVRHALSATNRVPGRACKPTRIQSAIRLFGVVKRYGHTGGKSDIVNNARNWSTSVNRAPETETRHAEPAMQAPARAKCKHNKLDRVQHRFLRFPCFLQTSARYFAV